MKKLVILAFICLFPIHSNAATEGDTYSGFQFGLGTFSFDDDPDFALPDFDLNAILVRFGKHTGEGVSIEGRFGIGIGDDSTEVNVFGTPVNVGLEIDNIMGIYLLMHSSSEQNSSVYGVIGLSKGKATLTASVPGFGSISDSEDETDLSYGVGLQADKINIEFMQYFNKSDFDFSAISFGVMF